MIDSCGSARFSTSDDEDEDEDKDEDGGGVRRLTMVIEEGGEPFVIRIDDDEEEDEDKQGE